MKSPSALVMQYEDAAGRRRTEFQFVPKRKPVKFSGGPVSPVPHVWIII